MKPSQKPSTPPLPPDMERLAKKIVGREYTTTNPDAEKTEDSGLIALRLLYSDLLPVDKKDRISREPGSGLSPEDSESDGLSFDGIASICRGDVSSALDVHSSNLRGDVIYVPDKYEDELE
jgi:hypothetical protein